MSKKMLWYACLGLLCCSVFALVGTAAISHGTNQTGIPAAACLQYLQINKTIANGTITPEMQVEFDKLMSIYPSLTRELAEATVSNSATPTLSISASGNHPRVNGQTMTVDQANALTGSSRPAQMTVAEKRAFLGLEPEEVASAGLLNPASASLATSSPSYTEEEKVAIKQSMPEVSRESRDPNPLDEGGEDCATAVVIATVPYTDTGNTCDNVNNYDYTPCDGYTTTGAPDVTYSYTPAVTIDVDINLCLGTTNYDTRLTVLENGVLYDCTDDDCSSPLFTNPWVSSFSCLTLTAGNTYCIIVDGWSTTDCGDYTIDIAECEPPPPCDVVCDPGDTPEVFEDYTAPGFHLADPDGGCNNSAGAELFQDIVCGETVCGTTRTYFDGGTEYRDTDWFRFTLAVASDVSWVVTAETSIYAFILTPCPAGILGTYTLAGPCVASTAQALCLPAGTYSAWVGPSVFTGVPPSDWEGTLTCTPCVEPTGRCCYGNPEAPSCDDGWTLADCNGEAGSWLQDGTCALNPCPVCSADELIADVGSHAGTTCGFGDDVNGTCASPYDTGEDYVYEWTVTAANSYSLHLQALTATWVRVAIFDACPSPTANCLYVGNNSSGTFDDIFCAALGAGTYYILIDLWIAPDNCVDDYTLDISICGPCDVECLPGDTPEVFEAVPTTPAEGDAYGVADPDGGCNNTVPTYQDIVCGESVCGITFGYVTSLGDSRDTDWFHFTLATDMDVTWSVEAETAIYTYILNDICPAGVLSNLGIGAACQPAVATALCLPAGTYTAWVGPQLFGAGVPVSDWRGTLTCTPCVVPTGRCCYGPDPQNPICAEGWTLADCNAETGTWAQDAFCPCPIPPANDLCDDAIAVAVPSSTFGSNILSTLDAEFVPLWCGTTISGGGVWYSFIGTGTTVTATTCDGNAGFGFDTKLNAWCRGCETPMCVAGNDDGGTPDCAIPSGSLYKSRITFCTQEGCEYLILVHGFGGGQGDFQLTLSDDGIDCVVPEMCCPIAAPCDPVNDLSIYFTADNSANVLSWMAPQAGDYNVYSATSPNQAAYPAAGWTYEATVTTGAGTASWTAPAAGYPVNISGFGKYYIVVAQCEGIQGRCCYLVGEEVICDVIAESECFGLGGNFDPFLDCTTICPAAGGAGENCADPIVIPSIPATVAGNTCDNVDDYTYNDGAGCPYINTGSYDEAYTFTPATDVTVTLDLCNGSTNYDTQLYILDGGTLVACNDDACSAPLYASWVSHLDCVPLSGGVTYCIVIDAYSYGTPAADCGDYTLVITECAACDVECEPGDTPEVVETVPTTPAEGDVYSTSDPDGGCNNGAGAELYQPIACGETICGITFTYTTTAGASRDTDWFEFTVATTTTVTWTVTSESANIYAFIVDHQGGLCTAPAVLGTIGAGLACIPAVATATVAPGTYVAWVGPQVFTGIPVSDYRGTLTCP